MSAIIPRPMRDILWPLFRAYENAHVIPKEGSGGAPIDIDGQKPDLGTLRQAEKMIRAIGRTMIAAIGVFALYKGGGSLAIVGTLGVLASCPSVLIVTGSWLMYHGVTAVVASVASGSFKALAIGLIYIFWGRFFLENHDDFEYGYADRVIKNFALSNRESVAVFCTGEVGP